MTAQQRTAIRHLVDALDCLDSARRGVSYAFRDDDDIVVICGACAELKTRLAYWLGEVERRA